jgi:hypothetical protein
MERSLWLSALLALSQPLGAQVLESPGPLVAVSVEVNGRSAPLYRSPDGSSRSYLEAKAAAIYAVRLRNLTGERLGVALDVDGLNAIDGLRPTGRERLYILDPWESTLVRGWRSSLDEVHLFTFVDEAASYAARTDQANGKMGWIETKVYRERRPVSLLFEREAPRIIGGPARGRDSEAKAAPLAPPAPGAAADQPAPTPSGGSYPGTGWGRQTEDRAVEVSFDPEAASAQLTTFRYEYRSALMALGVIPQRDRLFEREHGFAQPPLH